MDRDLRLLADETEVLSGTDSCGRYEEPPLCAVAISAAGYRVTVRPGLDRSLTARLRHLLTTAAQASPAPGLRQALPPAVSLLDAAGITAAVRGGPSFLAVPPLAMPSLAMPSLTGLPLAMPSLAVPPLAVPSPAGPALAVAAGVSILHSGRPDDTGRAAGRRRPASWDAPEWAALLGGQLGPWAMLAVRDQIVSICHTPRYSPMGAEAGTWTDPEFRGNRYACATTAAWANLMGLRDDRPLFYSTAAANSSSQRVAARLGLARIGWIWALHGAAEGDGASGRSAALADSSEQGSARGQ